MLVILYSACEVPLNELVKRIVAPYSFLLILARLSVLTLTVSLPYSPLLRVTEEEDVIAHIQHLHAYGTTRNLKGTLIDSRYKYVLPRGKAPTIYELSGTWASDKQYGNKLASLLETLAEF